MKFYEQFKGFFAAITILLAVSGANHVLLHVYRQGVQAGIAIGHRQQVKGVYLQAQEDLQSKMRQACQPWFTDKKRSTGPGHLIVCKAPQFMEITGLSK